MNTEFIEEIWKECPKSIQALEDLPLYSVLLVLGGYFSIGIGTFHFLLTILERFAPSTIFYFVINIIFGFGLLLSFYRINTEKIKWSAIAVIFSLALIALGGIVGALSGLIGLFGGGLAFLSTQDETMEI